uniref:Uncharacterized protein n=1 Tax=Pithovirus LCDPAC02 TaxID=2506601 RepID=A0A481YNE1_9VIRU|nr:MAG: hypothetical protein LCDPAC02_00070 [Pithovirus LCDPAC02]
MENKFDNIIEKRMKNVDVDLYDAISNIVTKIRKDINNNINLKDTNKYFDIMRNLVIFEYDNMNENSKFIDNIREIYLLNFNDIYTELYTIYLEYLKKLEDANLSLNQIVINGDIELNITPLEFIKENTEKDLNIDIIKQYSEVSTNNRCTCCAYIDINFLYYLYRYLELDIKNIIFLYRYNDYIIAQRCCIKSVMDQFLRKYKNKFDLSYSEPNITRILTENDSGNRIYG